ncbi:MAG: 16S rRNA methyltransferase [Thermoplasmataceae archaeon]
MFGLRSMLSLVVLDAELETIPDIMLDDYSIRIQAKKRGKSASKILLDSNFMHAAIERYFPGESNRRGRPDIIFHLLMTSLESILNKKSGLRVIIHTRNNLIIEINPSIRLPKSYNRFVGLMEDLFDKEAVGSQSETLMKITHGDWRNALSVAGGEPILLSPRGIPGKISEVFHGEGDKAVIIGGFSQGDFISDVYSLGAGISIYPDELTIWSVAMESICQYERDYGYV